MITRILRSIAGPGLDDPDPERRLAAIARQDPPLEPEALAELARTDPEPEVRAGCIARIDDAALLLELMDQADTAAPARDRLEARLSDGLDLDALLEGTTDLAALRHLLDAAPSPAAEHVLARIDDEDVLADVAAHHRRAPVRTAAAARVVGEDALRRIARGVRERDKDVARSVRERLERLKDARAEAAEAAARIEQLASDARHLSRIEDEPHLIERLELLRRARTEACDRLAATAPTLAEFRVAAMVAPDALTTLDGLLQEMDHRIEDARAAVAAREEARSQAEARVDTLSSLVGALERLRDQVAARIAEGSTVASERGPLTSALDMEDARWRDTLGDDESPAALMQTRSQVRTELDALMSAFDNWLTIGDAPTLPDLPEIPDRIPRNREEGAALWALRADLREQAGLLDAWLGACAWPDTCAAPAALAAAREQRTALAAALAALDGAQARLQERIGKLAARMERALDARKLKPVTGMQRDLKRQLEALPEIGERDRQRQQVIETRIAELRDWEYFATAPKREALCVAMEQLAGDEQLPVAARADEVKRMRAEWNALGPLRGEEGAALATRFDAAAEQAFAPARAHFEAEAGRRAENSANRRRICEELDQFLDGYDWEAADWKAVERIYRSARDEWQRFEDVDRDGRNLGKRYHKLTRTLKQRLEARWQANIVSKEALVEAARALVVDGAPVPDAARQAKALQARWKEVDITPRSVDRKLWKAFRAACDAVFSGLSAVRDHAQAAHAATREQLLQISASFGDALDALRSRGPGGIDSAAIAELPEAALREAVEQVERSDTPPPERKASADALRNARDLLRGARDLRQALKTHARGARLRTALDHDIACVEAEASGGEAPACPDDLPAEIRQALAQRGRKSADADQLRRMACIDLELALSLDSPAEDAQLRLARQVERLNSGMRGEAQPQDVESRVIAAIADMIACPGATDVSLTLARRARAALESGAASA